MTTTLRNVPTERVAARAALLLAGGKIRIRYAADIMLTAEAVGTETMHDVTYGWPVIGEWRCTCTAARLGHRECSHIVACDRVWQPEPVALSAATALPVEL